MKRSSKERAKLTKYYSEIDWKKKTMKNCIQNLKDVQRKYWEMKITTFSEWIPDSMTLMQLQKRTRQTYTVFFYNKMIPAIPPLLWFNFFASICNPVNNALTFSWKSSAWTNSFDINETPSIIKSFNPKETGGCDSINASLNNTCISNNHFCRITAKSEIPRYMEESKRSSSI